jgi:hypothetical protein
LELLLTVSLELSLRLAVLFLVLGLELLATSLLEELSLFTADLLVVLDTVFGFL